MELPVFEFDEAESSFEQILLIYINAGLKPILVHAPYTNGGSQNCTCGQNHSSAGKHPIPKQWEKPASFDELRDQLARLKYRPNVGLVLGKQPSGTYLVAVDVDDEARFDELVAEWGELPETPRCDSGRGYRLFFELPPDVPYARLRNVAALGGKPGVDVKVEKGQVVVAPSIHASGKKYEWTKWGTIAPLPMTWAVELLAPVIKLPEWIGDYTPQTLREDKRAVKRAERYLEKAVIDDARMLAGCQKGFRNPTLSERAFSLFSLCNGMMLGNSGWDYVRRELEAAAKSCGLPLREIRNTLASAEKKVVSENIVRVPVSLSKPIPEREASSGKTSGQAGETERPAAVAISEPQVSSIFNPLELIQLEMDKGAPAKIAENVARLLAQHPIWNTGPAFDNYSQMKIWPYPLPAPISRLVRRDREVVDADHAAVQGWLMSLPDTHRVRVGRDDVHAGIALACSRRSVDLLRLFIERLPEWDREPRLETWVTRYLGAPDTPYIRATGRAWLVACVERALAPGSLVDVAPVLEGLQQSGKNYAINTLFAGGPLAAPWLCIIGKKFESTENMRLACTRWVLHDDEFRARDPENVDALKSWASRTQETYRVPYAKEITVSARRGLLIVSTNLKKYLHDPTGNRRWLPWATGRIDVDGLGRIREQLFAEAFYALKNGSSWRDTMSEAIYAAAADETEERRISEPLRDQIESLIALKPNELLSTTSIGLYLNYRIENIDKKFEMKVHDVMRELGYSSVRVSTEGSRQRVFKLDEKPARPS